MFKNIFLIIITILFISCGNMKEKFNAELIKIDSLQNIIESEQKKSDSLKSIITLFEDSIEMLSYPSDQRYNKILFLIKNNLLDSAIFEINDLKRLFPYSQEASKADTQIDLIEKKKTQIKLEEERRKALGFKVFKDNPSFTIKNSTNDFKCSFSNFRFGRAFEFGYCNDVNELDYRTADKDNVYILASMRLTTNDDSLYPPNIIACIIVNGKTKNIGYFASEYSTWTSYGAKIGNYSDDSHDFTKVNSVNYNIGAEISKEYSQNPILILTPVVESFSIYDENLDVEQIHENYIVIKILNRNKL